MTDDRTREVASLLKAATDAAYDTETAYRADTATWEDLRTAHADVASLTNELNRLCKGELHLERKIQDARAALRLLRATLIEHCEQYGDPTHA